MIESLPLFMLICSAIISVPIIGVIVAIEKLIKTIKEKK